MYKDVNVLHQVEPEKSHRANLFYKAIKEQWIKKIPIDQNAVEENRISQMSIQQGHIPL